MDGRLSLLVGNSVTARDLYAQLMPELVHAQRQMLATALAL